MRRSLLPCSSVTFQRKCRMKKNIVFKKNFGWNNGLSSLSWIGSMFLCFGRLFQMTFPDDCFGSLFQVTISDACFRWLFRITVPDYYFRCLFQMTFPDDCFGLLFQMTVSDYCSRWIFQMLVRNSTADSYFTAFPWSTPISTNHSTD